MKKPSKIKAVFFAAIVLIIFYVVIILGQYIVMLPSMLEIISEQNLTDTSDVMSALLKEEGLLANAQFVGDALVVAVMMIWYYRGYVKKDKLAGVYVSVSKKFTNKYNIFYVVLLILLASSSLFAVYAVTDLVIPAQVDEMNDLLGGLTDNWFGLAAVCIGAPVAEELAIRGIIIQKSKRVFGLVACMIISGICFGVLHGNIVQGLYAFPMGLIFGYIAYKFNTVIPTIIGHALHNTIGGTILSILGLPGSIVVMVCSAVGIYLVHKNVTFPEVVTPAEEDVIDDSQVDTDVII